MPGFLVLQTHHLPEFAQTHVYWVSDAIQPFDPWLPPSPLALNLSQHQDLSNDSALRIRWPKYWSFSISPSNEYSGLISFRIDWLDLLVVQGTLKSLLLHHSSKASMLRHSAFFSLISYLFPHYTSCSCSTKSHRFTVSHQHSQLFTYCLCLNVLLILFQSLNIPNPSNSHPCEVSLNFLDKLCLYSHHTWYISF